MSVAYDPTKIKNPAYASLRNPVSDVLNSNQLLNPAYRGLGTLSPTPDSVVGGPFQSPAPPKNTSPNTITFGGGKPDYAFDIYNDPAFKMLRDSLSAAGIADASKLRGSIQQALINFGAVPDLPQDVLSNSGLDTSGTAALAANNPFSTLKRLQQAYEDQQTAQKNQLAARGILSSGETGYQLGRLGQQSAQNQYDATSSLLGGIGTLNDQYVAGQRAAAEKLAQGAFSAESNAAANNYAGAGTSVTATWDPATGLYKDANGSYYRASQDASGNWTGVPVQMPPPSNIASTPYTMPSGPTPYVPGTIARSLRYD